MKYNLCDIIANNITKTSEAKKYLSVIFGKKNGIKRVKIKGRSKFSRNDSSFRLLTLSRNNINANNIINTMVIVKREPKVTIPGMLFVAPTIDQMFAALIVIDEYPLLLPRYTPIILEIVLPPNNTAGEHIIMKDKTERSGEKRCKFDLDNMGLLSLVFIK